MTVAVRGVHRTDEQATLLAVRRRWVAIVFLLGLEACRPRDATPDGTVLLDWRAPSLPMVPDPPLESADQRIKWTPKGGHGSFVIDIHVAADLVSVERDGGVRSTHPSPVITKLTLVRASRGRRLVAKCDPPYVHYYPAGRAPATMSMPCYISVGESEDHVVSIVINGATLSIGANPGLGDSEVLSSSAFRR